MKAEIDWRGKKEEKRLYWKVREERKQLVRERFERVKPVLGERGTRLFAANEALSFGTGGVRAVAEALGLATQTLMKGKRELKDLRSGPDNDVMDGRQRRPGGGLRLDRRFQFFQSQFSDLGRRRSETCTRPANPTFSLPEECGQLLS